MYELNYSVFFFPLQASQHSMTWLTPLWHRLW